MLIINILNPNIAGVNFISFRKFSPFSSIFNNYWRCLTVSLRQQGQHAVQSRKLQGFVDYPFASTSSEQYP